MQNDKTTLYDLSFFSHDGGMDIFSLTDRTITLAGRDVLRKHFIHPPQDMEQLLDVQDVVRFWTKHIDEFPAIISNGTLVMLGQYFDDTEHTSLSPQGFSLLFNDNILKLLHKNEYSALQFSLSHLRDLLKGCAQLSDILKNDDVPTLLKQELKNIEVSLKNGVAGEVMNLHANFPYRQLKKINYHAKRALKNTVYALIHSFSQIDAWYSMAKATVDLGWNFPEFITGTSVLFDAGGLYHPMLKHPVAYNIKFDKDHNFMLLTGANMSGKTTFLRSIGVAAILAHLGCGVPANSLLISGFHNVTTHMQVEDNIFKGESYFYAEVQRMKHTAEKVVARLPCIMLMDEIFKGTNVHDAYECTRAVISGLLLHPHHLMVLSTHLYEVAHHFSDNKNIIFGHFVTDLADDGNYGFTYTMQQGISNDRIGYRILQKEGIISLLNNT